MDVPRRIGHRWRNPLQVFMSFMVSIVLPFVTYISVDAVFGVDITPYCYIITAVILVSISAVLWIECLLAVWLTRQPPQKPLYPYPPASVIITAFLPNEKDHILQTVYHFINMRYPAPLQIILAYNSPEEMPELEANLADMARRRPCRFIPLHVPNSQSKAENLNAAIALVTGDFVGIFDADHFPSLDSFTRAWKWLSSGYDVVQGHCVVRNGDSGWVARSVAVEFETIYAIGHPGSERLHNFGFFGGSNGFWRRELLTQIRMDGSMLTEDIDCSMRAVMAGGKVISDPGLISTELATTTVLQLWNQRLRWSQGWFQVSLRHFLPGLLCKNVNLWQKLGFFHLFVLRELYPWASVQIIPILAFLAYRGNFLETFGSHNVLFLSLTAFTFSSGPAQIMFAYRMSNERIKCHTIWWWAYFLFATVFFAEFKNVIARVAHFKEVLGQREWIITPRPSVQQNSQTSTVTVVVS